jgi:cystathionine beta-lyase
MEQICYVERKGTNSFRWDYAEKIYGDKAVIPLTVADMDFKCPECVRNALKEYTDMGAFGYSYASDEYYENYIEWERKYHHIEIKKEWIRYAPGVVVGMAWLLEELFQPGDACITLVPVYGPIIETPKRCGLKLVKSELINTNGYYTIDFQDFEKKIIENDVKLFILCSPHNPIGRVWKEDELKQLVAICKKHQVFLIADEIHHDIILGGNSHYSILNIEDYKEHMAMLTSPAKTFNLAGAENSFMVLPGETIREKIDRLQDRIAMHSGNTFGHIAATAAYREGREWLNIVLKLVEENYNIAKGILLNELPLLEISPMEGTFLMWVDFGKYWQQNEKLDEVIARKCGVVISSGNGFGGETYKTCARINLATSQKNVRYAMEKIAHYFKLL